MFKCIYKCEHINFKQLKAFAHVYAEYKQKVDEKSAVYIKINMDANSRELQCRCNLHIYIVKALLKR